MAQNAARGVCGVGVALLLLATGQQSVYVIIICIKICKSLVAKVAKSETFECYSQFRIRIALLCYALSDFAAASL